MLVAPANIGRNDLHDDAVMAHPFGEFKLREVNTLDFHLSRSHVRDAAIGGHDSSLPLPVGRPVLWGTKN